MPIDLEAINLAGQSLLKLVQAGGIVPTHALRESVVAMLRMATDGSSDMDKLEYLVDTPRNRLAGRVQHYHHWDIVVTKAGELFAAFKVKCIQRRSHPRLDKMMKDAAFRALDSGQGLKFAPFFGEIIILDLGVGNVEILGELRRRKLSTALATTNRLMSLSLFGGATVISHEDLVAKSSVRKYSENQEHYFRDLVQNYGRFADKHIDEPEFLIDDPDTQQALAC